MLAEFGQFALVLSLLAALAQTVTPAIGAARGWADYMRVGDAAAYVQFALATVSFAALCAIFMASDFSVTLVYLHSHSLKPDLYKFAGVWGNHEGSILLWCWMLALFGATIALFGRRLPLPLKARALAIQGAIGAAFIAFVLFTSNPFARWPYGLPLESLRDLVEAYGAQFGVDPASIASATRAELNALVASFGDVVRTPPEGSDLNPVLQDPGLAFHPPFLYLGYVGLSTVFAFAVAALMEERVDAAWARWARPWTLASWVFLTIGIGLGSYWAYYELGWGGWWFWDPVENASFMPWLAAAALFHSAIVVEKRGELRNWTILLAILGFSLSLLGTFIVRSGVLTSVHAFASDPSRGVFILLILAAAVGGALYLYSLRAARFASHGVFAPVSRESALLLNNVLLAVSTAAIFVGTLAPVAFDAFGEEISVGPRYYNIVFGAIMFVLILALPIGAMLPWKRGDARAAIRKLAVAAGLSILVLATVWLLAVDGAPLAPIGAAIGAWAIFGTLTELADKARVGRAAASESVRRLTNLPRADWGKAFGHIGLGVMALGVTLSMALETEDVRLVTRGDTFETGGYQMTFLGVQPREGPNFEEVVAGIALSRDGRQLGLIEPSRRAYPARRTTTTEVALRQGLMRDLYVVLGDRREDGRWALRTYVKPFVSWIWIGALLMSIGGLISLTDRRLRVGAPAARRAAPTPTPSAAATPAE